MMSHHKLSQFTIPCHNISKVMISYDKLDDLVVKFSKTLKFTLVVDNDTTVHDVHTYTVVFSPSVLIKCSICPYQTLTRTP